MINLYLDEGVKNVDTFKQVIESSALGINVFSSLDGVSYSDVDIAVIWLTVPQCLKSFTNLKLVLTSGSGIDHVIESDLLPKSVTTIRLVDDRLRNKVFDYVVDAIEAYKLLINEPSNANITVGVMGLGLMGNASVRKLRHLEYNVIGWARTAGKERSVSKYYTGSDGLKNLAKESQVIVCQLPLTKDTGNILNENLFCLMPDNGYIINVGRGGHLNEYDLVNSIKRGHLKGACLDVFKVEPLPPNNILRGQDEIILTPHIAGGIFPEDQAKYATEIISKFFNGTDRLEGIVNFEEKY
jgi:glyoxylate/hydroxypyruvate reductase A